jgi:uncharacterized protein YjbJ (UPF0337 family)
MDWTQIKGKIDKKWGNLDNGGLDEIGGHRKPLLGMIQERYGMPKEGHRRLAERQDMIVRGFASRENDGSWPLPETDIIWAGDSPSTIWKPSKPVRDAFRAAGAKRIFLPAYSPDLNPIEQVFAKLKHLIFSRMRRAEQGHGARAISIRGTGGGHYPAHYCFAQAAKIGLNIA